MKFVTGRILLLCLLLSNLAIGAAGYVALRALDARYTELFNGTVPTLNSVRALAWQVSRVQRGVNRFGAADGVADEQRLRSQTADLRAMQDLMGQVLGSLHGTEPDADLDQLQATTRAYSVAVAQWRELALRGEVIPAAQYVLVTVRPAHDALQDRLQSLADTLASHSLSRSDSLSGTMGSWASLLLAVAAWPFWVAAGGAVLAAVYVVAMAVLWSKLQNQ